MVVFLAHPLRCSMSPDTITLRVTMRYIKHGSLRFISCLCGCGTYSDRRNASSARRLITGNLQSAEVVELADTPSNRVALEILYKLLIINLLPFASITSDRVPRHGQ